MVRVTRTLLQLIISSNSHANGCLLVHRYCLSVSRGHDAGNAKGDIFCDHTSIFYQTHRRLIDPVTHEALRHETMRTWRHWYVFFTPLELTRTGPYDVGQ